MLIPEPSSQFKKDLKRYKHKQEIIDELYEVIDILIRCEKLPKIYKDHFLIGNYIHHRECHIRSDILLVYFTDDKNLYLERIGSHSELF